MEDTGVLVYTARHLKALHEATYAYVARESCAADVFQAGLICDEHSVPLVARATLGFQLMYFILCKCSHVEKLKS